MLVTFAKADTIGPVLILFACLAAVIIAIAPVLILAAVDKLRRELREANELAAAREDKMLKALVAILNEFSRRA